MLASSFAKNFFKSSKWNTFFLGLLLTGTLPLSYGQYKLKDSTEFITYQLPRYVEKLGKSRYRNYPEISRTAILRILLKEYYADRLVSGEDSLFKGRYYHAFGHQLSSETFRSLNTRDMFSYCMIAPEFYMQNCGSLGRMRGRQIFGVFYRGDIPLEYWSKRQLVALHANRDSVVKYIVQMWPALDFIGENTKDLLVELMVWELIPKVLDKLQVSPADNELYSLLVQIMMRLKFRPFEESPIYEQLYGPASYIGSQVESNDDNRNEIIKLAKDCFETRDKSPRSPLPIYNKRARLTDPTYSKELLNEASVPKGPNWKWKKVEVPHYRLKM